ncbi:MAG: hypothetical protein FWH02_00125 [Oscillospiraceae bacterium]|nr:hypothetical protein [Oscillospiraceae bacterium]
MTFSSLEQRMAHGYIDMLPSFVPDENAPVSVSEQEQFYVLIKSLYQLAYDEPLLFVTALHGDDAFPTRYKKAYGKPALIGDMRKFTKAINALLTAMFLLGKGEDVTLNKRQRAVLSRLGIDGTANLPAAWKWMASKDGANISKFSHCLFDDGYPYTSEIYARLLGSHAFKKIENWMAGQGYKRHDIYHIIASDCNLTLTIANPKWGADAPRGGHEYKIRHTGISAQYDDYTANPAVIGLCIPNGMKAYLENFDTMEKPLQAFVVSKTKKCDKCGYCVQTDKTGSRLLAYTAVEFEGKGYKLCNYYPGYGYSWTSIDDGTADMIIEMLSFMDKFAPDKVKI